MIYIKTLRQIGAQNEPIPAPISFHLDPTIGSELESQGQPPVAGARIYQKLEAKSSQPAEIPKFQLFEISSSGNQSFKWSPVWRLCERDAVYNGFRQFTESNIYGYNDSGKVGSPRQIRVGMSCIPFLF
jgi:hypothetical protein